MSLSRLAASLLRLPAFCICAVSFGATVQITSFKPSVPSPQPVGTPVTFRATATTTGSGPLTYRFEVAQGAGAFSVVQDFSLASAVTWAPSIYDGPYTLRVTARDLLSGDATAQKTTAFTATSLVTGTLPVATATANPLVALFSAPNCPAGSSMRAVFRKSGATTATYTDFRPCHSGSQNFYVAGMYPSSTYMMDYQVMTGSTVVTGPTAVPFTTGPIPTSVPIPTSTVLKAPTSQSSTAETMLLVGSVDASIPYATDETGATIWYYQTAPGNVQLTRLVPGGTLLMVTQGSGTGTGDFAGTTLQEIVREIDLAGNTVRQTNAGILSEQVLALGGTHSFSRLDHEAIRLANGYTAVLGTTQAIYPAGTQGSTVPIDIMGAQIVVLDTNLQAVWYWDSFSHAGGAPQLDINRQAIGKETCVILSNGQSQAGCPQILLSSPAADWLHGNMLQLTSDNDLILCMRDQDWTIKIDYNSGAGTGNVLWRLGNQGDFTLTGGTGPFPWFSAQHYSVFENPTTMSVYDNGQTRVNKYGGHSRGMVLSINQSTLTANVVASVDLGVYSSVYGVAQLLANGNYAFASGQVTFNGSTGTSQAGEWVTSTATQVYNLGVSTRSYRLWRLVNLYTAPL